MNKLKIVSERIQSKVDEFKYIEEKPVFYWKWVKKLMGIKLTIIRNKYRDKG